MKVIVDNKEYANIEFTVVNSQFNKNKHVIANSKLNLEDEIMKVNAIQILNIQLMDEFNNPALMVHINQIKVESDKQLDILQSSQTDNAYYY